MRHAHLFNNKKKQNFWFPKKISREDIFWEGFNNLLKEGTAVTVFAKGSPELVPTPELCGQTHPKTGFEVTFPALWDGKTGYGVVKPVLIPKTGYRVIIPTMALVLVGTDAINVKILNAVAFLHPQSILDFSTDPTDQASGQDEHSARQYRWVKVSSVDEPPPF